MHRVDMEERFIKEAMDSWMKCETLEIKQGLPESARERGMFNLEEYLELCYEAAQLLCCITLSPCHLGLEVVRLFWFRLA